LLPYTGARTPDSLQKRLPIGDARGSLSEGRGFG
jgi:hypothetical protein